jgi:hypothetical protein
VRSRIPAITLWLRGRCLTLRLVSFRPAAARSIRPDENQRFQEAEWPKGLICYLHHEAGVWHVLANRRRVIMRSDDKADRKPGALAACVVDCRQIINYQRITRWIEITHEGGSARDLAYDTVALVLSDRILSRRASREPFPSPLQPFCSHKSFIHV